MFFCDYLNVWQQFPAGEYPDYLGGRVVSIDGACGLSRKHVTDQDTGEISEVWAISGDDADIEYSTPKFGQHRGSFETTISIRMVEGKLEVRGNPSAFGRLDNLFGVSLDEGIGIYNSVLQSMGLPVFTAGVEAELWLQKEQRLVKQYTGAHITRIDLTVNQAVGSGRVRDYNRWLASQKLARSSPDDQALEKFARWDFATVYTSDSKFWINVKHYDKSAALEELTLPEYLKKLRNAVRDGTIKKSAVRALYLEAEDYLLKLAHWCAEVGIVRSEWSLRSRWFVQHPGEGYWAPGSCESSLIDTVTAEREKIAMRAIVYQVEGFENLSPIEYKTLDQWKKGEQVKLTIPRTSFYRIRASILEKTGHDIASRPVVTISANVFRPIYFQVRPLSLADAPVWYQRPCAQQALMQLAA